MRVRCYLREIRGRRGIRQIAEAAGVNRGSLSRVETGQTLPRDEWIPRMEEAYGAPFEQWYHPLVIRVLEPDEAGA